MLNKLILTVVACLGLLMYGSNAIAVHGTAFNTDGYITIQLSEQVIEASASDIPGSCTEFNNVIKNFTTLGQAQFTSGSKVNTYNSVGSGCVKTVDTLFNCAGDSALFDGPVFPYLHGGLHFAGLDDTQGLGNAAGATFMWFMVNDNDDAICFMSTLNGQDLPEDQAAGVAHLFGASFPSNTCTQLNNNAALDAALGSFVSNLDKYDDYENLSDLYYGVIYSGDFNKDASCE